MRLISFKANVKYFTLKEGKILFNLISSNGEVQYDVKEYVCDSPEDVKAIPTNCAMGSKILVISTGEVYVLNSEKRWVLI